MTSRMRHRRVRAVAPLLPRTRRHPRACGPLGIRPRCSGPRASHPAARPPTAPIRSLITARTLRTGGGADRPTPDVRPCTLKSKRMAYAEQSPRIMGPINEHASALAHEWRRLTRAATAVALITAPAFFLVLFDSNHLSLPVALIVTMVAVVMFRGLVEVVDSAADPLAEPVRRAREPQAGRHRRPPALLVLADEVPAAAGVHRDRLLACSRSASCSSRSPESAPRSSTRSKGCARSSRPTPFRSSG